MKASIGIGVIVLLIVGFFFLYGADTPSPEQQIAQQGNEQTRLQEMNDVRESAVAATGEYAVVPESSVVRWSGQKPLIDGYTNTGSLAVTSGSIAVADGAVTGSFTMDMESLSVSETKAKPGSESALEGHLKGERWFDVATYPTATFVINEAVPSADGENMYNVTGDLTMKGETNELAFPAEVYVNEAGQLIASASFEFDRTKWGVTSGSASFFDNLADNAISDMVALSFELVAVPQ